jgi:hypothetical protein
MKKGTRKQPYARVPRRLNKKWKLWTAMSFIRVLDSLTRKEALEILTMTRERLPRRGRVQYDWSTDDQWKHP